MLDHEETFLFKTETIELANSLGEPGVLDNVEALLTDVITSPRFDSEVFTLERSLQVMLGRRIGTTLIGMLTVGPEVFEKVAEGRVPPQVLERLPAWRGRAAPGCARPGRQAALVRCFPAARPSGGSAVDAGQASGAPSCQKSIVGTRFRPARHIFCQKSLGQH